MNWRVAVALLVAVAAVLGVAFVAAAPDIGPNDSVRDGDGPSQDATQSVVVRDESGATLGTVDVRIADNSSERYTGLSDTESLGPNEGMLFVYGQEGEHTYVMRGMDFPIDIVFIGADGRINKIYHAPVEDDNEDLTPYPGRGQWVLEVPYNWTTEHGVEVGDTVAVPE
jgi:uncharacterized membrane protein (UPF0127 family)